MKSEVRILHTQVKMTKENKPYTVVTALITLNGYEFVRTFNIF